MIQLNTAFKVDLSNLVKEDDSFTLTWKVPEDLPYFQGHFPNQPVLPAVAVIDLVLHLISQVHSQDYKFKNIKSAKFAAVISPNDELEVQMTYNKSKELWSSIFKNKDQDLVCRIQFSLLCEETSATRS